jgi:hypothetical protein
MSHKTFIIFHGFSVACCFFFVVMGTYLPHRCIQVAPIYTFQFFSRRYVDVPLVRIEDAPHDGLGSEPLATAPPQPCLSVAVELLMSRCFVNHYVDKPPHRDMLSRIEERPSSETSVLTRVTRRHIPENNIRHCYRREYIPEVSVFRSNIIVGHVYTCIHVALLGVST